MDMGPRLAVTWEQILLFARSLESDAFHDNVSPPQGARLVRLLLEFDRNIVSGNVRKTKPPSGAPPAASTG